MVVTAHLRRCGSACWRARLRSACWRARFQRGLLALVRAWVTLKGLETEPYMCLGPATCESHHGERPMSIVWRLLVPMTAELFRQAKLTTG